MAEMKGPIEAGEARQDAGYRYLLCRSGGERLGIQVVVDTTAPR